MLGLSRRHVTVSPVTNEAIVPVLTDGSAVMVTADANVNVGLATTTVALAGPSLPTQL